MTNTCLLIDDDRDEYLLFESALKEVNPAIAFYMETSGSRAIEKLRTNAGCIPKVIFLDLNMPEADGRYVLAELKKIDRLKEVPVVIYSTSSNPAHVDETRQLGSAGYIVKPSRFEELVKKLTGALDNITRSNNYFFYGL
ncbi:response regulator [Telluribacter sp.]|jgi:CheY-like chemotaxis protein|uniref:response regulator n=1 Tax=Telluribacter sp. TaxID=1978767 RepID=UPI002E12C403|nr:response regulator [Telluribacter sp.]